MNNFAGILSRGLILPKYVQADLGGTRSDIGLLGAGIYFSDCLNTSLKYAKPSKTKGTRLIVICDVAVGECKEYHEFDTELTEAPEGFDSVHGVRSADSKFIDSEYVVFDTNQCRIRYIAEIACKDIDGVVELNPIELLSEPLSNEPEIREEKGNKMFSFLLEHFDNIIKVTLTISI